jgi:membrane protein implicated in regulation of membrane protease activity
MRRGKSLETLKKITSVNFDLIKRFWFAFGIIAFLTTSLSTVSILSDLLALIYYLAYIISLPMVPLSIYIWRKNTKRIEKQSDISENKEDS